MRASPSLVPPLRIHVQAENYRRIALAIEYLRVHATEQPHLADVASQIGLSEFHFQRLFSEWAGISPKRFLQFLTKEHAKALLAQSHNVLDAALQSGLSGSSRLHDLMIACEALTPGELRAQGAGLHIQFGFADSPFGPLLMGVTARGICHLHFVDGEERKALEDLFLASPKAQFQRDDAAVGRMSEKLFSREPATRPLHLLLRGTNFQIKVWEALLRIPYGQVASYGSLAKLAGIPGAARAVGSAIAKNNIALLIPCHRVIRESGDVGEYRWGSTRKSLLLAREHAQGEVS